MFLSTGSSLLRAEGFSCSLGVLNGGLGISKLQWIWIREPDPFFFRRVVDAGGKFATGVVDTGGAPALANISTNFWKYSK